MGRKRLTREKVRRELELPFVLRETVRRHRQVVAAARELGCSAAYIHVRFKRAGLTLGKALEGRDPEELLCGGDNL